MTGQSLSRLQRRFPLLQVVAVVAVFVYGFETIPGFGTTSSIDTMLVLAALLGLSAIGQTLVVMLGGLDLSIPGFILVGAVGSVELGKAMPFALAVALMLLVSAVVGGAVGWICHRQRLQPLVLTLAVGSVAGGLMILWTTSRAPAAPPAWLATATSPMTKTLGLPFPPVVLFWVALAVAFALVLHRTPLGRRIYAAGDNPAAAQLALVRTDRVWTLVFALSACFSAVVGVLLAGFVGADDSGLGDPYLFQGLTAVIVGGTTFFGTRGDYTHTAVGALLLTELSTVLIGKGLSNAQQQMLFGLLILLVVAIYGRQSRVQDRI